MSISDAPDENEGEDEGEDTLAPDEVFCTSCGETIKEDAEVCPECGVRQKEEKSTPETQIPDGRVFELQKVARKSPGVAVALGILLTPASYWYVGRTGLALVNFLTLNYLLLGFIIVPIHSYKIINDAQDELKRHGEGW